MGIVARFRGPSNHQNLSTAQRKQLLFHALKSAVEDHPALGVVVVDGDTARPRFQQLEQIDLAQVVAIKEVPRARSSSSLSDESAEARAIDAILSHEHSIGFKGQELPFWRVILFQEAESGDQVSTTSTISTATTLHFAFIWHHVIGDGKSGLAVLSTISNALNSLPSDSIIDGSFPAPTVIKPSTNTLFPALESILPFHMSPSTVFSHRVTPLLPAVLQPKPPAPRPGKWSGGCYQWPDSPDTTTSSPAPVKTNIKHILLPLSTVNALQRLCRKNKTSMTPLLQAVMGRVIVQTFPEAAWIRCAVALSLRRFFPQEMAIDDSIMGLWVNAFHLEYTRADLLPDQGKEETETSAPASTASHGSSNKQKSSGSSKEASSASLWTQAQANSARIAYEVRKADTDVGIAMLKYIRDFRADLLGKRNKPRMDSYAVTNVGVYESGGGRGGAASRKGYSNSDRGYGVRSRDSSQLSIKNRPSSSSSETSSWSLEQLLFSQSCHVNGSAVQFCILTLKDKEMCIALSWQDGVVSQEDVGRLAQGVKGCLSRLAAAEE